MKVKSPPGTENTGRNTMSKSKNVRPLEGPGKHSGRKQPVAEKVRDARLRGARPKSGDAYYRIAESPHPTVESPSVKSRAGQKCQLSYEVKDGKRNWGDDARVDYQSDVLFSADGA